MSCGAARHCVDAHPFLVRQNTPVALEISAEKLALIGEKSFCRLEENMTETQTFKMRFEGVSVAPDFIEHTPEEQYLRTDKEPFLANSSHVASVDFNFELRPILTWVKVAASNYQDG